ncbi:hypothetical protein [Phytomonospora endophytica]|uniref:Uncharacterized protein n=1 Tax=Phytomonospora endophytica TaxID=714109 RepID=A0A841FJL9_9ACTN|nr:hypothetical protein [Phytomonospora endophytica]MBB6033347.1 hypothetical protein [Phytomonospora endophytica]GIG71512.1 hypothetical protein Pen01_78070 [Phytomonospora endophytica]
MRTQGTVKRRSLLGSLSFVALTVVGCAAMLLPSALSGRGGADQAPPFSLVDDAGGGSESPGSEPSSAPSTHTPTPGPGNPMPGGEEGDGKAPAEGGGGGGFGEMSFGVQTALSLGLVAIFALFLIPGRRPPRSAGGRTGR